MKPYQKVFKLLTEQLRPLGFQKHGSSWWQLRHGRLWQRVHIHKFTYGDLFRVHAAIHIAGSEDDAPWLNGPSSHDGWFEEKRAGVAIRRYTFRFQDSPDSISTCAAELGDYIFRCVLPWFEAWTDEKTLLTSADSPLSDQQKEFLRMPNHTVQPTAARSAVSSG